MKKIDRDTYKVSVGFYFCCANYPWPSKRTNELLEMAKNKFEEIKASGKFVRLIISNHWATQGYWVETEDSIITSNLDSIIKEYRP